MAIRFPSTEYFEKLGERMAGESARFRRLGFIDTTFGVTVTENNHPRSFILSFEVFELAGVREVDEIDATAVDFTIAGDAAVWREMIDNIRRNGEADTHHDINTLTHFGEALAVSYAEPDGHDKLYRFMESIQGFFDLTSQLEVSF
jgi:hypothetical protein